jgi:DNA-binding response OmpR family regulator
LVIDDEPEIGQEICEALQLRNIAASYAENIRKARELMKSNERIAIVSVDYNMPEMNGVEVIEALKAEFTRPMAFIMVTGDERQTVAIEAIRAHAQDFVAKPVDPRALLIAIRRAEEQLARLTEVDDLQSQLDAQSRVLSRRIASISDRLQQREALLRTLLKPERAAIDTVAEEMRAPLAPLLDHLKSLKGQISEIGAGADTGLSQAIMQSGLQLAELVEALFGSDGEMSAETLKCVPVDMSGVIKRIAPALRRLAAEKGVELKTRIPASLPYLYAEEGRLARALSDIAVGLMSELSSGDHLAMMALIENPWLITSFRISARAFDERLLVALTADLPQSLDGLSCIKPAVP